MKDFQRLLGLFPIFLILNAVVDCGKKYNIFNKHDTFNGYKCSTKQRTFTMSTNGAIACSYHCSSDASCKSLFYGQTTGNCFGCADVYTESTNLDVESDTTYYMDKDFEILPTIARLSNDSGHLDRGRVEVRYNSTWGTVCDDGWVSHTTGHEQNNVEVLCRMFGYSNGTILPKGSYPLAGADGVPIWIDDLACQGFEKSIFECDHPGYGIENCVHSEDLSVHCQN